MMSDVPAQNVFEVISYEASKRLKLGEVGALHNTPLIVYAVCFVDAGKPPMLLVGLDQNGPSHVIRATEGAMMTLYPATGAVKGLLFTGFEDGPSNSWRVYVEDNANRGFSGTIRYYNNAPDSLALHCTIEHDLPGAALFFLLLWGLLELRKKYVES